MNRIIKYRFVLILLALLGGFHIGFSQAKFTAEADAREIVLNGVFTVTFHLENGQGRNFRPPSFDNFEYVSGPSTMNQTSIVNGRSTTSVSYTYTLMGVKVGTFRIQPASIVVKGKSLATNSVAVKVVQATAQNAKDGFVMPSDEDIFIRAEVVRDTVFPGQQVILKYRIYTSVNIRDFSTLTEDKYADFYVEYLRNYDRRPKQEVINGKQYTVQTIKAVSLFPQKTGSYRIRPLVANVWVPKPGSRRRTFFSQGSSVNKRITANALNLTVVTPPDGAPASFSGAIGKYRMQVGLNKKSITQDDALVVEMVVKGNSDGKRWGPPALSLESKFEVYDPNTTFDRTEEQNGVLYNTKKFEYLMLPKRTGKISFRVPFTYFDTDSMRYMTWQSPILSVQVAPGTGQKEVIDDDVLLEDDISSLAFRPLSKLSKERKSFLFSPGFFILAGAPFLFLGWVWYQERDKNIFAQLDPEEKRRRIAKQKALKRMEAAAQLLENGSSKEYYDSIATAIYGYISDKLKIPISDLTKSTIERKIEALGVDDNAQNSLKDILRTAELNVYAGVNAGNRQQIYDKTLSLITTLEAATEPTI